MPPKQIASYVCSVVVDVRMPGGCDIHAGYEDLPIRWLTYDGGGVIWEPLDESLDSLTEGVLTSAVKARSGIARG